MDCSKCIHKEMCKYTDELPKIQEQFPFVSDFSCKYMDKGVNKPVEKPARQNKKTVVAEEITIPEEKPEKVRKASVKRRTRMPKEQPVKEESFMELSIQSVFGADADINKKLEQLGCAVIGDVYKLNKSSLTKKQIETVNTKLSIFQQPAI